MSVEPEECNCVWFKRTKLEDMDTNTPAKRPKGVDIEASSDCLGVSLIIRRIMQNFSDRGLLKLSFINKQWNYEARSELRNRGNLTAKIGFNCSCKRLAAFASDLLRMPVVPFSGITLWISRDHECQPASEGALDPSYKLILDGLVWKRLSLQIQGCFDHYKDCPVLALVKKILENFSCVLEELTLAVGRELEFFEEYLQDRHFPRLKKFNMKDAMSSNIDISQKFLKALVLRAPNLQELHLNRAIKFTENVLEGSSAVLVVDCRFAPLYEQVCESIIGAFRVNKIHILRWPSDFDSGLFSGLVPMLLQATHTALTTLWMDLLFAVPLMCYGICLENVTELQIAVERYWLEDLDQPIVALLKGFDFTRVVPKLIKVQIFHRDRVGISQHQISRFVEQGNAVLMKTLPDRAINIKHLTLQSIGDSTIAFLAQMCPAITAVSLETKDPSDFSFQLLWEHFENLEELNAKLYQWDPSLIRNFDSAVCGIFPEEVAELQGHDDEYLRRVNIVPIMPSITCMKGIKSFKVYFKNTYLCNTQNLIGEPLNSATYFLSRVTGLIAIQRCPDLTVTIATKDRLFVKALSHLQPYACFVVYASSL